MDRAIKLTIFCLLSFTLITAHAETTSSEKSDLQKPGIVAFQKAFNEQKELLEKIYQQKVRELKEQNSGNLSDADKESMQRAEEALNRIKSLDIPQLQEKMREKIKSRANAEGRSLSDDELNKEVDDEFQKLATKMEHQQSHLK